MLKYFHHVIFDPLSAWEQFKLNALIVVIAVGIIGAPVLIYNVYAFIERKWKGAN